MHVLVSLMRMMTVPRLIVQWPAQEGPNFSMYPLHGLMRVLAITWRVTEVSPLTESLNAGCSSQVESQLWRYPEVRRFKPLSTPPQGDGTTQNRCSGSCNGPGLPEDHIRPRVSRVQRALPCSSSLPPYHCRSLYAYLVEIHPLTAYFRRQAASWGRVCRWHYRFVVWMKCTSVTVSWHAHSLWSSLKIPLQSSVITDHTRSSWCPYISIQLKWKETTWTQSLTLSIGPNHRERSREHTLARRAGSVRRIRMRSVTSTRSTTCFVAQRPNKRPSTRQHPN